MAYILNIHLVPRATRNEIKGFHGQAVKIRLQAPPVDQKANRALLSFLSQTLKVPESQLTLIGGTTARAKRVRIDGLSQEETWQRLGVTP